MPSTIPRNFCLWIYLVLMASQSCGIAPNALYKRNGATTETLMRNLPGASQLVEPGFRPKIQFSSL